MIHCGRRLEELIKKSRIPKKKFAALIETPPTTVSGWFKQDDLVLGNIRKSCEVFGIELWEFFVETGNEPEDYVSSKFLKSIDIEIMKEINNLPDDKKIKLWDVIVKILSLLR